jgi:hypothetical protein
MSKSPVRVSEIVIDNEGGKFNDTPTLSAEMIPLSPPLVEEHKMQV